mmetsp:Transcript_25192/g.68455  ORF Transcript_25192/g.68455 Transcript_25192/m.68455 type:complete len:93 (+) Transcript_25192:798-1076(+)
MMPPALRPAQKASLSLMMVDQHGLPPADPSAKADLPSEKAGWCLTIKMDWHELPPADPSENDDTPSDKTGGLLRDCLWGGMCTARPWSAELP